MKTEIEATLLRRDLDDMLKKWRRVPRDKPKRGWICDIREALGMTGDDLGKIMKVTASTVSSLQVSEVKETIAIGTLRRVAKAMNCELVYGIVPKRSLEKVLQGRRQGVALNDILNGSSQVHKIFMKYPHVLMNAYAKTLPRKRIWKDFPELKCLAALKAQLSPAPAPKIVPEEAVEDRPIEDRPIEDRPPKWD